MRRNTSALPNYTDRNILIYISYGFYDQVVILSPSGKCKSLDLTNEFEDPDWLRFIRNGLLSHKNYTQTQNYPQTNHNESLKLIKIEKITMKSFPEWKEERPLFGKILHWENL